MYVIYGGAGGRGSAFNFCVTTKACLRSLATSGTSKDQSIMQLLRLLFLSSARYNFKVMAKHVPGKTNSIADALSRFNMQAFFQLAPQARRTPVAK